MSPDKSQGRLGLGLFQEYRDSKLMAHLTPPSSSLIYPIIKLLAPRMSSQRPFLLHKETKQIYKLGSWVEQLKAPFFSIGFLLREAESSFEQISMPLYYFQSTLLISHPNKNTRKRLLQDGIKDEFISV